MAAVRFTTVQMTKLPLIAQVRKIRHDLLYKAWTDKEALYTMSMYV
jgi:hypothetical protein